MDGEPSDRVLVTGGRNFCDFRLVYKILDFIKPKCIIHGGASGADSLADRYARELKIPLIVYPAQWNLYKRPGRKNPAGFIRNQQMIDEGKPTLLVVFPGGSGTQDMVKRAKINSIPITKVIT